MSHSAALDPDAPPDPDPHSPPALRARLRRELQIVSLGWAFGSVWMTMTSGAPLTQFGRALGATNFQFGILAALPFLASLISIPASLVIDRTGARKRIFLTSLYAQRLLWIPIALAPLLLVRWYGPGVVPRAMTMSLWLVFLMHAAGAIGSPAWVSWMGDLVPERVRGKYFSHRRQWGFASAIPAAWVAGWLLDRPEVNLATNWSLVVLGWCAVIFLVAAVFGIADIAMFHFVEEIPIKSREQTPLRTLFAEPLHDRRFLWFGGYVATLTFSVSFMGTFVTLFLIEKLHVSNRATQMMLLIGPLLAQLLTYRVWGVAVDRFGKRPVIAIASLALGPVALAWCALNEQGLWLGYLLAAIGAVLWSGVEIANFNFVLDFSSKSARGGTNYVAANSVIVNVAGCLGGVTSGLLAQWLRDWSFGWVTFYEVLFIFSGVLRLASVIIFLPMIHEPTARPAVDALRFVTANIYNNLFGAIFLPVRMVTTWVGGRRS